MPIRSNCKKALQAMLLLLMVNCFASFANAQPVYYLGYDTNSDEETILVEKEVSQKIPYGRIAKAFVKRIFDVNVESMFSGGKNKKTACVRNFSEYAERTKYRLSAHKDKVEMKFSLNF